MVKSSDATDIKRMEFDLAGKANADRGGVRETLDEENIIIVGRWLFGESKTIDYSMEESRQAEYKLVFFVSFVFFFPLLHVREKGEKKKKKKKKDGVFSLPVRIHKANDRHGRFLW